MPDLRGIHTLVALAWAAAAFLYEMGVMLEWPEVELLARLGVRNRARTSHWARWSSAADCADR